MTANKKLAHIVGDCPVGCGGDDLIALKDKLESNLFFYCYSCGCSWDFLPANLDNIIVLDIKTRAPNGAMVVSKEELKLLDMKIVYSFEPDEFHLKDFSF